MAPATFTVVVLLIAAVCLGTSDAQVAFKAPALRYVSTSKWNTTMASAAGMNLSSMAAVDIHAVRTCIASMPNATVMTGVAGSALNENFANCTSSPEWGSYTKVIDFKDITAFKMYLKCAAFNSTAYKNNSKYLVENHHFITHANAADIALGFPVAPVYLVTLNNATAGSNSSNIDAAVMGRYEVLADVASLFNICKVQPWLPKYASQTTNAMTTMTILGFKTSQAAAAYKTYKVGNAPGLIPALPLYLTVKQLLTSSKDVEFKPTPLMGNYYNYSQPNVTSG